MKVNCYSCVHFYITWIKGFPYGCKLMGFKSKGLPSKEVYLASGQECLGFKPKQKVFKEGKTDRNLA